MLTKATPRGIVRPNHRIIAVEVPYSRQTKLDFTPFLLPTKMIVCKTPLSPPSTDFLTCRGYIGFTPIEIGSRGSVYQTSKDGHLLAVKVFHISAVTEVALAALVRELSILQSVRHPNCQRVVESMRTTKCSKVYIVMEPFLSPGATMHSVVTNFGPLCEWNVKTWFPPIALAIRYLHHSKIAHLNLSLNSILLDEHYNPYVTDYARIGELASGGPVALPKAYSSPQMLQKSPFNRFKQDVWSLGAVFFTMLNKEEPFSESDTDENVYAKMLAKSFQLTPHVEAKVSSTAKELIQETLEPDEEKRASTETLCKHLWMPAVFGEAQMVITQMENEYREEAFKKIAQPASDQPPQKQ